MDMEGTDMNVAEAAELLGKIDRGERRLFEEGKKNKDFGEFISRLWLEDAENRGVFISYTYSGRLRVDISFEQDPVDSDVSRIIEYIEEARKKAGIPDTLIWCRNENRKMVAALLRHFQCGPEFYASRELAMARSDFKYPINPVSVLQSCDYEEDHLDRYLILMEKAFVHISQPGSFTGNKAAYREKFGDISSDRRFQAFKLDGDDVGLYYQHQGEIEYLAVDPFYQSRGYGTEILRAAFQNIFDQGYPEAYLYCVDKNPGALRFYLRQGMQVAGHSACIVVQV